MPWLLSHALALALVVTLVVLLAPHSSLKCSGVKNSLKPSKVIRLRQREELGVCGQKVLWQVHTPVSGKQLWMSHLRDQRKAAAAAEQLQGLSCPPCVNTFSQGAGKSIISFAGNRCVRSK